MRSVRGMEDVVKAGPETSRGRNHAPLETPSLYLIQDATVLEDGQDKCELRPKVDSIDSPSAFHEVKAMRFDPPGL